MKVQVYDFRWNSSIEFEFQASVGNQFARKKLKVGDYLSIQIQSEVSCAGSFRDNVFMPCPEKIIGRKKCPNCQRRESNFIFTAFDGFNSERYTSEDLAKLSGPHVVYLAFFSESLIKVGVSKKERKTLRQIEQGSLATLYIAETPDGIEARKIETLFCRSGLADKIKNNTKKEAQYLSFDFDAVKHQLEAVLEENKACLSDYGRLKNYLLSPPELKTWEKVYHLESLDSIEGGRNPFALTLKNEESISGKIIAAKGNFLFLSLPEECLMISAKDLVGYQVEFDLIEPGLSLKQGIQSTLF